MQISNRSTPLNCNGNEQVLPKHRDHSDKFRRLSLNVPEQHRSYLVEGPIEPGKYKHLLCLHLKQVPNINLDDTRESALSARPTTFALVKKSPVIKKIDEAPLEASFA